MAETSYLGNSIEIRQYAVSIGYTNLQISRIQDKNTLWRGFRCRFRLADLLISCERKADSCKKNLVQKISGFLWMGPSLHESYTDAFWLNETAVCGCHQEIWLCACCWSVSLFLGIDRASLPVHYLLTRAAASGGEGRQLPPGTVEPDKSSLWMDLFSLDSVILIVVTCICVQF